MATSPRASSLIQTILFPRSTWTPDRAALWLRENGFRDVVPDVTARMLRYRQHEPSEFQRGTFRTIRLGRSDIRAVVGRRARGLR